MPDKKELFSKLESIGKQQVRENLAQGLYSGKNKVNLINEWLLQRENDREWLGNNNRKTMIKVKTIGQMLPFKNGTALPSPSQAPGSAILVTLIFHSSKELAFSL